MDAPTSFPFRHTLPPLDIPYHILGIPCPPPPDTDGRLLARRWYASYWNAVLFSNILYLELSVMFAPTCYFLFTQDFVIFSQIEIDEKS